MSDGSFIFFGYAQVGSSQWNNQSKFINNNKSNKNLAKVNEMSELQTKTYFF